MRMKPTKQSCEFIRMEHNVEPTGQTLTKLFRA